MIHFYLLPAETTGVGSASWLQMEHGEVLVQFAGYTKPDKTVLALTSILALIISVFTLYLGVDLLLGLTTVEDLLLNSLAVSFISDVDEIVFSSFAPTELKVLLENVDFKYYGASGIWRMLRTLRKYIPPWLSPFLVPTILSVTFYCAVLSRYCTFDTEEQMFVSKDFADVYKGNSL